MVTVFLPHNPCSSRNSLQRELRGLVHCLHGFGLRRVDRVSKTMVGSAQKAIIRVVKHVKKKPSNTLRGNTYILLYHSWLVEGVIIMILSTHLLCLLSLVSYCTYFTLENEPILRPYSDLHPMQLTERLTLLSERKT